MCIRDRLSHSHYDHIGALPYVKKAYPEAVTLGAEHAKDVLLRPGARKLMKELGKNAREEYEPGSVSYTHLDVYKRQVVCDTSEFSWNAPYASAWIAMGMQDCGWHHWGVARCAADTMGEKSMDTAAKVISLTAADLLCDPALLKRAQEELSLIHI